MPKVKIETSVSELFISALTRSKIPSVSVVPVVASPSVKKMIIFAVVSSAEENCEIDVVNAPEIFVDPCA